MGWTWQLPGVGGCIEQEGGRSTGLSEDGLSRDEHFCSENGDARSLVDCSADVGRVDVGRLGSLHCSLDSGVEDTSDCRVQMRSRVVHSWRGAGIRVGGSGWGRGCGRVLHPGSCSPDGCGRGQGLRWWCPGAGRPGELQRCPAQGKTVAEAGSGGSAASGCCWNGGWLAWGWWSTAGRALLTAAEGRGPRWGWGRAGGD